MEDPFAHNRSSYKIIEEDQGRNRVPNVVPSQPARDGRRNYIKEDEEETIEICC